MADDQYTRAKYTGRRGNHHIIGVCELPSDPGVASKKKDQMWVHYYGYNQENYVTLVYNEDIRLMVNKWEIVPEVNIPLPVVPELPPPPPLQSKTIDEILGKSDLDILTLPGVTPKIAQEITRLGLDTKDKILDYDLTLIKGVAEKRAEIIKGALQK